MLAFGTNVAVFLLVSSIFSPLCLAIRSVPAEVKFNSLNGFAVAPVYRNLLGCSVSTNSAMKPSCDPTLVHVAMTLDLEYLRGTMAAVNSILRHASCPENVFFHFIAAEFDPASPRVLNQLVRSTFPSLNFRVYVFREDRVLNLISSSIRQALENPLNFARNYLGDILCIDRVIYLDSDVIVVDDIYKLWSVKLTGSRLIGAPEYCDANFSKYFTTNFWSDPALSRVFAPRKPCYFNTGVMVIDLAKWRRGNYRDRIENWMEVQRKKRIYDLGSLPPFLLVFAGDVEAIDHKWNQHGLGGNNVKGSCRRMHPGSFSLLHWSGKGKPWSRLDAGEPCPVDLLWKPYDLYESPRTGSHDDLVGATTSSSWS